MKIIFIHQNFPAQYLHIVRKLVCQKKNQVYFITQTTHSEIPGVRKLLYRPELPFATSCHAYTAVFDNAVRTGVAVADKCKALRDGGFIPDLVVGHCGWGETLFVKDIFPETPLLSYFEFFYHAEGADVGFDPEFAPTAQGDAGRLEVRNAVNRMSFAVSDWGHTATSWQRSLFPEPVQARITTMHEGVDTDQVTPDSTAWIKLARENIVLTCDDEVITYVSRNLEPYRGFHIFMRGLPEILRRHPRAHVLIAGGDGLSYGDPLPSGKTFRETLLSEVGADLDVDRVHFLGQIPYHIYLNILQVSSVHVYLTYPFVLSWSLIEAMSVGCAIVASATAPVLEVLNDRENALLVDFFSVDGICDRVDEVLEDPEGMEGMREAARATAIREFDTTRVTLPRWTKLLRDLARHRFPIEEPPTPGLCTLGNKR